MHRFTMLVAIASLSAACTQLPKREGVKLNEAPPFDGTFISSEMGILATDLAKVPGSICIIDKNNACSDVLPYPVRSNGSKIVITPDTKTTPEYHAIINHEYKASLNTPFASPTASEQFLDEVTAKVVGTAVFTTESPKNGYPGIGAIRLALKDTGKSADAVYWFSGANVIAVAKTNYEKVSSALQVTGTGFGANGSTYNNNSVTQQKIWVGVVAHKIDLKPTKPSSSITDALSSIIVVDELPSPEKVITFATPQQ